MPSEETHQRGLSSMYMPSNFFSEDLCSPADRQVGFWKREISSGHHAGTEELLSMPGSKSNTASMLEKFHLGDARSLGRSELGHSCLVENQKANLNLEQYLGSVRTSCLPMTSQSGTDQVIGSQSSVVVPSVIFDGNKINYNGVHYEKSLFSSSLSEIFARKLRLSSSDVLFRRPVETFASRGEEDGPLESLEEIEAQTIGNLLPDDDDLLSGIVDELDYVAQPCNGDDAEEFDLFSSGGGLELEMDDVLSACGNNKTSDFLAAISNGEQGGPNSPFAGEHPYGEHPSRTLFVRNINSNVEDSELKTLFEQYGDIRTLYTACKHRGFVMISYYDIRAARNAMRALQNKPLRRRKLDIHFSIPKDNPSEKDVNQGTLVVFNLDSSVSNDDLRQIFGVYGEIKEIRETPHKRHHKFIEFYDIRAADAALRALNKSDIAGKRIKLEPSRPGGARRCLMQNFSVELEQEQTSGTQQQGSSPENSLSGCYGPVFIGSLTATSLDNGPVQGLHSTTRGPLSPLTENMFFGLSHGIPHSLPSLNRVSSIGSQPGIVETSPPGQINFGFQSMSSFHPHSLPDYTDNLSNGGINYNSPSTMASSISALAAEGMNNYHIHRVGAAVLNQHSFDLSEGALDSSANGSCPLHGRQYIWGNTNNYHPHPSGPMMWPSSSSFVNGVHTHAPHQLHGLHGTPIHMINTALPLPQHHHVGSAPAINPSLWDRRQGYVGDTEASVLHPGSLGSMGFSGNSALHSLELASHSIFPHIGGNSLDHPPVSSPSIGIPSPQQRAHIFAGRSHLIPPMPNSFDGRSERLRSRRGDANATQIDNKKQYELDIERIIRGEDSRTTLMIKNIPNKYTSKMLLAAIDEHHRGTYDFIYLPIDFKNKCNVGYAFINLIDAMHIIPFSEAFNGKKWEKFNSEKVASLAYARIQGKAALIAHFQNSSLMNEDKRCRPILFHSDGPNAGDQEPFPMGANIRSRPGKMRTSSNEQTHQGSPPISGSVEEDPSNGTESSSGSSSKDME